MKNTKPVILIIITLIIGFLIGMLTSAQLRNKRMKPVRIYSSGSQLKHTVYRYLEPTEEQVEKLDVIFDDFSKQNRDLQMKFRKEFEDLMESNWSEIKPMLSKEQLDKLEEMNDRRSQATRRYRPDSSKQDKQRGNGHGYDSLRNRNNNDSRRDHNKRGGGR